MPPGNIASIPAAQNSLTAGNFRVLAGNLRRAIRGAAGAFFSMLRYVRSEPVRAMYLGEAAGIRHAGRSQSEARAGEANHEDDRDECCVVALRRGGIGGGTELQ